MLNTENAIENRDRHEDTWISVFLCRLFLCANVNVSKGAEKAGDSSENPQTGKEKQIYV